MSKKKIGLIVLLVVIIAIVVAVIATSTTKKEQNTNITDATLTGNRDLEEEKNINLKNVTVSTLDDGILYSTTDEEITPDVVMTDNYFDTTIADINLNFSSYKGKVIQIEGMYLTNSPYTFVGRYSTSNLCPNCPPGYSYFEYEFHGNELPELVEEQDWIKVVGTLKSEYDETINSDYYYIDVISMEVMNERGLDTVSN